MTDDHDGVTFDLLSRHQQRASAARRAATAVVRRGRGQQQRGRSRKVFLVLVETEFHGSSFFVTSSQQILRLSRCHVTRMLRGCREETASVELTLNAGSNVAVTTRHLERYTARYQQAGCAQPRRLKSFFIARQHRAVLQSATLVQRIASHRQSPTHPTHTVESNRFAVPRRIQTCTGFTVSTRGAINHFRFRLLGPFYGAIAVPSVTRCRCCCRRRRCCGHQCAGGVRQ